MGLHEVPENHDALNISIVEGVVMGPVSVTMNNFFAKIASIPHLTVESVHTIHVGGVFRALEIAVHVGQDVVEMPHLDVVEPTIVGNHCVVLPLTEVGVQLGRVGDGVVLEAMEVNDVDWSVGHGVVTPQRRTADWTHACQRSGHPLKCSGPDEHSSIGGSRHVNLIRVHTELGHDLLKDHLCVGHVIMAGGPVT